MKTKKFNLFPQNNQKTENIITYIIYPLFVIFFFWAMNLIHCGYHLVDDHEFLYYNSAYKYLGQSFGTIYKEAFLTDLAIRFRPIHFFFRIFFSLFIGKTNLVPYMILRIIQTSLCMIFLHKTARKLNVSFLSSIAFTLLSLIGFQACSCWKLGTQELQCTLFFSAGFYFLLLYLDSITNNRRLYYIISCICFILMSGYKESFILLIPFVILFIIFHDYGTDNLISNSFSYREIFHKILHICKNRKNIILPYIFIFIIPLLLIMTFVDINGYGTWTVSEKLPIYQTVLNWIINLSEATSADLKWYVRIGALLGCILLTYYDKLRKVCFELLLVLAIVIPQLIVYRNMVISKHYLLPIVIGFSYLFVVVPGKYNLLTGKRKILYNAALILLILLQFRVTYREAEYYRYRGEGVQTVLDTIKKLSSEDDIYILSCLNPNMEGDLTLTYWNAYYGYDNIYSWFDESSEAVKCSFNDKHVKDFYQYDTITDLDNISVIIMYNKEDRHWCYDPNIDLHNFTLYKCGTLDLYIRNTLYNL